MKKIVLIIPCYFEEEILESSFKKIKALMDDLARRKVISIESATCFVDDGSNDDTWKIISELAGKHKNVTGIKLSRNFGQQFALTAGIETLKDKYDSYITIDVDLQDDIGVIEEMISKQEAGASIVYGVRKDRSSDSFFKRSTAHAFYRFMMFMKIPAIYNHSEFRLIDNTVINTFLQYQESNMFFRGIFIDLGYNSDVVYYDRLKRELGETKYTLRKMISVAWEGITSFSVYPLRIVLYIGIMTFLISLIIGLWVVYVKISGRDIG